jgi:hypothetical protein
LGQSKLSLKERLVQHVEQIYDEPTKSESGKEITTGMLGHEPVLVVAAELSPKPLGSTNMIRTVAELAELSGATVEDIVELDESELQELLGEHQVGVLQRRGIVKEVAQIRTKQLLLEPPLSSWPSAASGAPSAAAELTVFFEGLSIRKLLKKAAELGVPEVETDVVEDSKEQMVKLLVAWTIRATALGTATVGQGETVTTSLSL